MTTSSTRPRRTPLQRLAAGLASAALLCSWAAAAEPDYERDIKPVLRSRCFACHGALKQEGSLRLDTGAAIRQGGDSGPALDLRQPAESLLLERVTADDLAERMPPEGEPLTADEISTLRAWIGAGASSPAGELPEQDPNEHWAFRPPQRPPLPDTVDAASANPIDAFLNQAIREAGAAPTPAASPAVLLRRVYLDLLGVPPTQAELQAFLEDPSPLAYRRTVDQLLHDARHGERWGRHWMDVWRYSDWYGRRYVPDVWNGAPQVWRWRDWIVRSLNQDRGYDQMVQAMLAGDELWPDEPQQALATGYLVRNWYALNPNDWMRNTVEHTGKAFLGLTFNCAHCHDHKYDPILHTDYFALRAFFEPIYVRQDRVPGEADPGPFQDYEYGKLRIVQKLGAVRVFDKSPEAPTWFYSGGDERNREAGRGSIAPTVPSFLSPPLPAIEPVQLPPRAWYPGLQPGIQQTVRSERLRKVREAEDQLTAARQSHETIAGPPRRLTEAKREYDAAVKTAVAEGRGALAGRQSLLLRAGDGRRAIHNRLPGLSRLPEGSRIEFQLRLFTDTHVNFQLAKDADKGLTAAYIALVGGRVMSYQPGGFQEFEAGRYRFADGQRTFQVRLELQPGQDRCLLTLRCLDDQQLIVDQTPVALNGWNPVGDAAKAVSFDARAGSVAAVDDWQLAAPAADTAGDTTTDVLARFDFEPPVYAPGKDVPGVEGWEASPFSEPPGVSVVSPALADPLVVEKAAAWRAVQQSARLPQLAVEAAEQQLAAARAELQSVDARIAADQARHGESPGADADALAQAAVRAEHEAKLARLRASAAGAASRAAAAADKPAGEQGRDAAIQKAEMERSEAAAALAEASAKQPDGMDYTPLSPSYPSVSTGRRTALARWITDPRNPLTARVAVNHIWMRHFHQPLVETVADFGRNGADPSHPQLLDWLATELIESGWSMKQIHRLIVTSEAYRRRSSPTRTPDADAAGSDRSNRTLWKMPTGRMEAEVVRDSLLHVAGLLNPQQGGAPLTNDKSLTTNRRALYYEVFPEDSGASPLGELFDAPSPLECYRRTRSVVPQQALALTNSELVHRVAARIIQRWRQQHPNADDQQLISDLFEQILTRPPAAAERAACHEALAVQRRLLQQEGQPPTAALESLARALLNHNDFITIR